MVMVWELEAEGERAVGLERGGTYDAWRIVAKGVSFPRFKHRVTKGVWGELDGRSLAGRTVQGTWGRATGKHVSQLSGEQASRTALLLSIFFF